MKRLLKALILLPLFTVLIYGAQWQELKAKNATLKVPESWIVIPSGDVNVLYSAYVTDDEGLTPGENVNFTTTDLGMDIDSNMISLTLDSTINMLQNTYDSLEVLEKGSNYVLIQGKAQDIEVIQKLVLEFSGSTLYYIAFTAFTDTFDDYKDIFLKVEKSLTID